MALPMAPPMMSPIEAAASRDSMRASQTVSARLAAEGEQDQPQASKRAFLRQQPVADALVPHEHQVEKRGERHAPLGADVVDVEHPGLVRLIGEHGQRGDAETERR